ncbi:MAG TPA: bifunctional 4-hydroxy-3-methylbut-2-enyl diphosphate reductase/30S ribosomal protein S1 [Clostridia bacterium]|nr:bifunctional 4-hydroxy-3-methylbut-2-enyl diphosphate reductase/30S ribosomal protein S1 [Clostridia bacterium]
MKILLAKNSGFCFGVRRAVEMAEQCAKERGTVYTYGNIIHNDSVVHELAEKGVHSVENLTTLQEGDTLIIRAHGAPPAVYEESEQARIRLIDATCPYVKRIHRIVEKAAEEGNTVLIAGKANHPEVIGICGWAGDSALVLETEADVANLPPIKKAVLVAQTTLPEETLAAIQRAIESRYANSLSLTIRNTICDTTRDRQSEAEEISRRSTRMLVLGSKSSANTQKLVEICKKHCKNTENIDSIDKLLLDKLPSDDIIGIVAGASTPDRMIREVLQVMSEQEKTTIETIEAEAPAEEVVVPQVTEEVVAAVEAPKATAKAKAEPKPEHEDSSDFASAFEKTMTRIHNGQVLEGTVISVVDGEVFVNVGYKSDGVIPVGELSSDSDVKAEDLFKEGDTIEVEVTKVNDGDGNVLLSRKNVESKKLWDELLSQENIEEKIFDAVGKEVVKGGLIADISGIRAFVPASQVSTKYIENLNEFVGKPMKLKVLEVDRQRKRIVASQKQVLIAEAAAEKHAKWEQLIVGSKVNGVVRRIADFGAFVDIGGIDGLVHVTDAAWGRVKHPSDVFAIGQEIEVIILNVDVEKERVSLGYKQLQPKPWMLAGEKYAVGSIVEGKVVRIVPFGAFVALESTIDGLIHISQVSVHRIAKVEDELKVGDVVRCKVLEVSPEAKRISLSRKEALLEEDPALAEQLAAEKAERDRQYAERQEQRQQQRDSQQSQQAQQPRTERPERAPRSSSSDRSSSRDSGDRRRRNNEDGEYELPPVQEAKTSLASLFEGLKVDE